MMQNLAFNWAIEQNNDKITVLLSGELSRNTLLPLWEQRASFLAELNLSATQIFYSFAHLKRIDSAGFALFCELLKQTAEHAPKALIRIENAPQQLLTLADLFGLDEWLASFMS